MTQQALRTAHTSSRTSKCCRLQLIDVASYNATSLTHAHRLPRPPGIQSLNYWAHAYKPKLPMSAQRCRHCRLTNLVIEYRVISWDNWLLNMFKDERLMGSYTVNGFSIESGLFTVYIIHKLLKDLEPRVSKLVLPCNKMDCLPKKVTSY